ncbi:MAG: 4-alpha-glucanotransferase [Treponema sp.]|jgi:4-alpha-glucanotransferase|nr:4-alpha-glucanotransferase [Treponema sp.]
MDRKIGVVIPIGALRGEKSLGVGEFPDLNEFASMAKDMGIGLIQLLPVNDTGFESSPYSALSAFALHPLYIRIGDIADAAPYSKKIKEVLGEFEKIPRFSHQKILRAKLGLLKEIYTANERNIIKNAESGELAKWIEKNPWVKPYAVFRRLKEVNNQKSWKEWAPEYQRVAEGQIEALWNNENLRSDHIFWVWVQEILDTQFSKAAKAVADAGIILEGDLPILINDDSCDVWAYPEYFHMNLSAGAPPDMYSPNGQNWGFPLYNWRNLEKNDYEWWKNRLKAAEKYYKAYRIDHVLGFFRIWASSQLDLSSSSLMGRFVPYKPILRRDLESLEFDARQIHWLSYPHIPTSEVWHSIESLKDAEGNSDYQTIHRAGEKAFTSCLQRINNEELWWFNDSIRGEKDIVNKDLHPFVRDYLIWAWRNRTLQEYEKNRYSPTWFYRDTRAYNSLSDEQKRNLDALIERQNTASEKAWAIQGRKLLSMLKESTSMLPCAEDLGEVPDCVPKTLDRLKILGLRVVRWAREWDEEGSPFIPLEDYPELSVCTIAVHDSSTAREWWDHEVEQDVFSAFLGQPALPPVYNPGSAKIILKKAASATSVFRVFQIQDILHLSQRYYAPDPKSERINVPGSVTEFNWTYRLPVSITEIAKDRELIHAVRELAEVKQGKKERNI